jgi:hypothetical protein
MAVPSLSQHLLMTAVIRNEADRAGAGVAISVVSTLALGRAGDLGGDPVLPARGV